MIDTQKYVNDPNRYLRKQILLVPNYMVKPRVVPANCNVGEPGCLGPRFRSGSGKITVDPHGGAGLGPGTKKQARPDHIHELLGFGRLIRPHQTHFKIYKTNNKSRRSYVNIYTGQVTQSAPCYFLPWAQGRITWVTLSADRPINYFFTSTLSGCNIYVSGDLNEPTVYHANAGHIQENKQQTGVQYGEDSYLRGGAKETYMDALSNQAAMIVGHSPARRILRLTNWTYIAEGTGQAGRRKANRSSLLTPRRAVTSTGVEGANLVGVRVQGEWNFQWQVSVSVSYTRPKKDLVARVQFGGRQGEKSYIETGNMPAWD